MQRTILVTGASKGIGQAIAIRLAISGFNIVIHYHRDTAGAQHTLEQVIANKVAARLIQFDVSLQQDCLQKITADIEQHGAYYGVVSNAGISKDGAFPMLSADDWACVIHTNLDGFYNVVHPCVMPMIGLRQGGRIIALSSISGLIGNRGQVNYSAAKAGIIGATKALATELAKRQITVNCVAPGLIETAMLDDIDDNAYKEIVASIPLKRIGKASEVAELVNFLASDNAAYITRQVISINGGMA